MGKYKVEVAYTVTYVKTFEVEASNNAEAIDKAEREASNTDMKLGHSGEGEYEGEVMEAPEDRGECPECGTSLIEVGNNTECPNCGKFY